mgnify:CR=1
MGFSAKLLIEKYTVEELAFKIIDLNCLIIEFLLLLFNDDNLNSNQIYLFFLVSNRGPQEQDEGCHQGTI